MREPPCDPPQLRQEPSEDPRLDIPRKAAYGLGDLSTNTVLTSLSFFYQTFFLVQVAGLEIGYAGSVQLVARVVDAFTDPMMGRLSDRTRWSAGRRRPYFLIAAIPFGLSFAALWWNAPIDSQLGKFAFYTAVYVALSLTMTAVSVPYLSLLPEMAIGYDARNSLNIFRSAGSTLGVLVALGMYPLADWLGAGEALDFETVALAYAFLVAAPWFVVFLCTWERPEFQSRETSLPLLQGLRVLLQHRSYRRLMGLYLCGRVSMDLVSALLLLYFLFVIGRPYDMFTVVVLLMLGSLAAHPLWLAVARRTEKSTVFIVGSLWWIAAQSVLLFVQPDWPRWSLYLFAPIAGIGYAVVDLMPWGMLGEVVDEDDLATGERREGLYYGSYTLLRKLAGSLAVWAASLVLAVFGYAEGDEQPESALLAIRILTAVGPALFLGIGVLFARRYPLSRARHNQILDALVRRDVEGR